MAVIFNSDELLRKIMNDLRVELTDEFDKNFERKAFFTQPWPERKSGTKGTLMNVRGGGGLRGSIRSAINNETITWRSNLPYAAIHNEGGQITVTAKMISFFWAKYYELSGKVRYKKNGEKSQTRRNKAVSAQAEYYKSLALKKSGDVIVIPQRRFIGHAPEVDRAVKRVLDANFNDIETTLKNILKP